MTAPTRSRPTRATRGRSDAAATTRRRRADPAAERRREARLSAGTVEAPERTPVRRTAERTAGRSRSAAAQRAYARRAQREGRPVERVARLAREEDHAGRASFVILIIALLTVGVAATLWLSTQAIADSYRLEDAKQTADQLAERADQLQREVTKSESASALAERAKAMGMVPGGDPARLVVRPDGRVVVVGEPTPAQKPKPPKPPKTPASSQPPAAEHGDAQQGGQQADRRATGGQQAQEQNADTPGAG